MRLARKLQGFVILKLLPWPDPRAYDEQNDVRSSKFISQLRNPVNTAIKVTFVKETGDFRLAIAEHRHKPTHDVSIFRGKADENVQCRPLATGGIIPHNLNVFKVESSAQNGCGRQATRCKRRPKGQIRREITFASFGPG